MLRNVLEISRGWIQWWRFSGGGVGVVERSGECVG